MSNNSYNTSAVLNSVTPDELIQPISYSSQPMHCISSKEFNFNTTNRKSGKVSSKSATIVISTILTLSVVGVIASKLIF